VIDGNFVKVDRRRGCHISVPFAQRIIIFEIINAQID
jgi:hypothetical protein